MVAAASDSGSFIVTVSVRALVLALSTVGDDWERFSLWFQSTDSPLSQDCYRLTNPQGEAFDVTIAPTMTAAADGETETYQAVFSRQPPAKDSDPMEAIAEGDHLTESERSTSQWGTFCIGQTILFSGPYTIADFYQCNGTLLSVNQHQVLYAVIGNKYGGTTGVDFVLPDLMGRVPLLGTITTPSVGPVEPSRYDSPQTTSRNTITRRNSSKFR